MKPNLAPVVNRESAGYRSFVGTHNAPRGTLVSKVFDGIFSDPNGDTLTYTVTLPEDRRALVNQVRVVETAQRLFIRLDADKDWKAIDSDLPDPLTTTATLTATDPQGLSASVSGDFKTFWDVPKEPTGLSVTANHGELSVTAAWDRPSDAAAATYTVSWRRSSDEAFDSENEISVAKTEATFAVAGFGEWVVQVIACNDAGCAEPVSHQFEVEALVEAPSGLTATAGDQSITLSWTDPSDTTISKYQYRVSADGGTTWNPDWTDIPDSGATTTSFTITGLTNDTEYTVELRAVTSVDNAGASSGVSATPTPEPTPGAPENFAVSATPGSLEVSATWDALDGATAYKLSWRQSGGNFEPGNETTISDSDATFTVSDYGEWLARLQGCNEAGCGLEAELAVTVVRSIGFDLAPTLDDEGKALPRAITVSWNSVPDAASYTLSWAPAATRSSDAVGHAENDQDENRLDLPSDQTTADVTVDEDGVWDFTIRALNDDDELIAMESNEMEIRVTAWLNATSHYIQDFQNIGCQTTTITGIQVVFTSEGVEVTWDAPGISSITHYQYIAHRGNGFPLTDIGNDKLDYEGAPQWHELPGSGAGTTSHTLTDLAVNTTYGVWLRGVAGSRKYCFDQLIWITTFDVNIPLITGIDTWQKLDGPPDELTLYWDDHGVEGLAYEYEVTGHPPPLGRLLRRPAPRCLPDLKRLDRRAYRSQ